MTSSDARGLLEALQRRLTRSPVPLAALRERDALLGQPVQLAGRRGHGAGIDDNGALLVTHERRQTARALRGRGHITDLTSSTGGAVSL